MSLGKKGQATCYQENTKRLDESNIDRVALAMSSNDCENFVGMLLKYSHGKRVSWDRLIRGRCISSLWLVRRLTTDLQHLHADRSFFKPPYLEGMAFYFSCLVSLFILALFVKRLRKSSAK